MQEASGEGLPERVLLGGAFASFVAFLALTGVVSLHGFDGADHQRRTLSPATANGAPPTSMRL